MRDLVVIGGGPGGYVAAIRAAQLGLKVALVEKDSLGGACLNRGCIPTKAYQYKAKVLKMLQDAPELGIKTGGIQFDMQAAKTRKDTIVANLVSAINKLLQQNHVEIIQGQAQIIDNQTVKAGGQCIQAQNILIAAGSKPAVLPIRGMDLPGVMTSDDIMELTQAPKKLLIIGGGVIGMEFASIFNQFGSQVTVIESTPRILGVIDAELVKRFMVYLKKRKITVVSSTLVKQILPIEGGLSIIAGDGTNDLTFDADLVLLAAGRTPVTDCLPEGGMEVELNAHGFIKVDQHYQTNISGIYAIGDVIGGPMLAHVASEEGIAVVEHLAGMEKTVPYASIPNCIFTLPEIAAVGMTEEEAKKRGILYKTGKYLFAANSKAMTMGETEGLVKIIADQDEKIIGVHIIGPNASDLILEGVIMVKNRMGVEGLLNTVHPHPTLGEAIMEALQDIRGRSIHLAPRRK